MKYRYLMFATLVAASGAVLAQSSWTQVEDGAMMVPTLNLSVSEIDGMDVYDSTGEKVGEVDDVLLGQDGTSMGASLDIGGFLGIGEKDVVLPLDNLTKGEDGLKTTMTKEELESLPEYEE